MNNFGKLSGTDQELLNGYLKELSQTMEKNEFEVAKSFMHKNPVQFYQFYEASHQQTLK